MCSKDLMIEDYDNSSKIAKQKLTSAKKPQQQGRSIGHSNRKEDGYSTSYLGGIGKRSTEKAGNALSSIIMAIESLNVEDVGSYLQDMAPKGTTIATVEARPHQYIKSQPHNNATMRRAPPRTPRREFNMNVEAMQVVFAVMHQQMPTPGRWQTTVPIQMLIQQASVLGVGPTVISYLASHYNVRPEDATPEYLAQLLSTAAKTGRSLDTMVSRICAAYTSKELTIALQQAHLEPQAMQHYLSLGLLAKLSTVDRHTLGLLPAAPPTPAVPKHPAAAALSYFQQHVGTLSAAMEEALCGYVNSCPMPQLLQTLLP